MLKYLPFLLLLACQDTTPPAQDPASHSAYLSYSTTSDSAAYYYRLGWKQIMDEGRYAAAEDSYRKSISFDPNFLLAQATLARLSLDLTERVRIFKVLERQISSLPPDERQVAEVYRDLIKFTNLRETDPKQAQIFLKKILARGEDRLRRTVAAYPREVYIKSEYLELLNSNRGAEVALDSFASLTKNRHGDNPFLLGYAASLQAELGNYTTALDLARQTELAVNDSLAPKSYAVYADVYFAMDSLETAGQYADRAAELDGRNLDATRLQKRINRRRTSRSDL